MNLTKARLPLDGDTLIVSNQSAYSLGAECQNQGADSIGGNAAWPAANEIFYIPFWVPRPLTAYKMALFSGTATSGNVDAGIYSGTTRLTSVGSTAAAGTNTVQLLDISDVLLQPGELYYMAMWCDNTSASFQRKALAAPSQYALGVWEEAGGAGALPATATPSLSQTRSYIPSLGVVLRSYA